MKSNKNMIRADVTEVTIMPSQMVFYNFITQLRMLTVYIYYASVVYV